MNSDSNVKNLTTVMLVGIMVIAFIVRFVAITKLPIGFTPDEAAQGYTAYSILTTGKDEWGKMLPINLRSYGDYKLPLYTYVTVPSIAAFGLNEFAVRLPSVIIGTLAVLFTYLLTRKLTSDRVALVAAFLLAISPWHIALSRGAFEANITVCLLPAGCYFFLKGLEKAWYFIPASLFFGLNLFSYHAARFVTPFIILALLIWKFKDLRRNGKALVIPALILIVFGLIGLSTFFAGGSTRVSDTSILTLTSTSDKQFIGTEMGENPVVARLFNNKLAFTLDAFSKSYVSYFSPEYLFARGPGELTYGMDTERGVLYWFEAVTVALGLFFIVTRKSKVGWFVLFWLLIAAVPAALAKGSDAGNRNAVAMPAWQIISAMGAVYLYEVLKNRWPRYQSIIVGAMLVITLGFFLIFLEDYAYHAPYYAAKPMMYGWPQAVAYIRAHQNDYSQIVVSRKLSEPQAQLAFFLPIPPQQFQQAAPSLLQYEQQGLPFLDELGQYSIGKFTFIEIPKGQIVQPGTLYVGTPDELGDQKDKVAEIDYPNGDPAFVFVAAPVQ